MTDTLKENLNDLRRALIVDRAIYGGTTTKRLTDQMTTLCCLVSTLADRLPPEAKTLAEIDERAIGAWRSSLCQTRDQIDALVAEAERFRINYKAGNSPSTQAVLSLIARERHRQVAQEGYTIEHDDEHPAGQLARGAACYLMHGVVTLHWPLSPEADNREKHSEIRRLEIAGALIVAEIERLLRKEASEQ